MRFFKNTPLPSVLINRTADAQAESVRYCSNRIEDYFVYSELRDDYLYYMKDHCRY